MKSNIGLTPSDDATARAAYLERQEMRASISARQKAAVRRERRRAVLIGSILFVVLIGGWQVVSDRGIIDPLFISSPRALVEFYATALRTAETWDSIRTTLEAALIGLVVGSTVGVTFGVLFSRMPAVRRGAAPFLTFINALPRPALAPIFILWFGLGQTPKVLVAVSIVFFVLVVNTMAGLDSIDRDMSFLAETMGMSAWQRFWLLEFPHSLPSIFAGLNLAAVYAVLGVVVSEIVAANQGLGQELTKYTNGFRIDGAFGILGLMAAVALLLNTAVTLLGRLVGGQRH